MLEVDLTISYANGEEPAQLVKLMPLEVQPGVNEPQILTIENAEPGRWTVQLDVDDPLEQDNLAYLAVEPPRPVRVAVETDDRFFFENSVSAFSRQAGLLTLDNQDPQVVIGKSTAPSATRVLVFQPEGESPWWTDIGEELDNVVPRVMMPQHPALRFTDPDAYSFVGAKQLSAPGNAQVWVASDQGVPLIYQTHRDGKTAIIVNMDPAAAEFYFSAWFPVFIHSAATYMAGRDTPLMASYRPSNVVSIPGVRDQDRTQLTDPTGANAEISGTATPPLNHLGFYTLANASGDWLVSCSLLSAKETLVGTQRTDNATATVQRGWSPAHWLTVLAIVILTVESLLYYRRKVG